MSIFNILSLIGGLCMFLFGMNLMGDALERRAGNSLERMLGKLTTGKIAGLFTGLAVTAIIQSSSATTVMVVGFVNSGLMNLGQAINVIMGANVGTTVTAWILSLGGISGDNIFIQLLKPASFTPILALIGIVLHMFTKSSRHKDTGTVLLGFAVLMFGMDAMSAAVKPIGNEPWFREMFVMFKNPVLGVIAGTVLTAIIQSSSASVGILQALSATGKVSFGAAIPIIMGQNIGTCITALLSSVGTNKNARRAALVHLFFNIFGTLACLVGFWAVDLAFAPAIFDGAATHANIAVAHSVFNIICTAILLPASSLLEKLAYKLIPETKAPDKVEELDERLLTTPAIALERCNTIATEMAEISVSALYDGILCLTDYTDELAASIREREEKSDHYEDILGSYLVKLASQRLGDEESAGATKLLKIIGDFERISDHAVNILESAEEMRDKEIAFTPDASAELSNLADAVKEILALALEAFVEDDADAINSVEPLEEVIDRMKEGLRTAHIKRLSEGKCSIEAGFVWSDLLTNLERTSDHCSNIAGCVAEMHENKMDIHTMLRSKKEDGSVYKERYEEYSLKYSV